MMRHFLNKGLVILFTLLMLFGGFTLNIVIQFQHYGRLINYVGIVRGASQRLVKLELEDRPSDPLIGYLDGILEELTTGKGEYGLPLPKDENYRKNLNELYQMWDSIKDQIKNYRSGGSDGEELLALSEEYFEQANDTVFAADEYT